MGPALVGMLVERCQQLGMVVQRRGLRSMLAEGHDEESVVKLAIADDDLVLPEVATLFEGVCRELGEPLPSLDEAIDTVTAAILAEIAEGQTEPRVGLRRLMHEVYYPSAQGSCVSTGAPSTRESLPRRSRRTPAGWHLPADRPDARRRVGEYLGGHSPTPGTAPNRITSHSSSGAAQLTPAVLPGRRLRMVARLVVAARRVPGLLDLRLGKTLPERRKQKPGSSEGWAHLSEVRFPAGWGRPFGDRCRLLPAERRRSRQALAALHGAPPLRVGSLHLP